VQREARLAGDRPHRLPAVGQELRLERVEPVEVVEAAPVAPHPAEREADRPAVHDRRQRRPTRERCEAERHEARAAGGEVTEGGVDEQLGRAVDGLPAAHHLLDQPALASRNR
jgi:hypothetical protein